MLRVRVGKHSRLIPLAGDDTTSGRVLANPRGAIYKSENKGETWGQIRTTDYVFVLQYLGAGEVIYTSYASSSIIYKSTNYGDSWSTVYTHTRNLISLVDLGGGILLMGEAGQTGVNNASVLKSIDNGDNWSLSGTITRNDGDANIVIIRSLCLMDDGGIVAGVTSTYNGGSKGLVYRSYDQGATWSYVTTIITGAYQYGFTGIISLGAGVLLGWASHGLYKSINYGSTWTSVAASGNCVILAGSTLYAGIGASIYKSEDSGDTWTILYSFSGSVTALEYLGYGVLLAGIATYNLLYKSTDHGVTWAMKADFANAEFLSIEYIEDEY